MCLINKFKFNIVYNKNYYNILSEKDYKSIRMNAQLTRFNEFYNSQQTLSIYNIHYANKSLNVETLQLKKSPWTMKNLYINSFLSYK
jgi:hypothetical protein